MNLQPGSEITFPGNYRDNLIFGGPGERLPFREGFKATVNEIQGEFFNIRGHPDDMWAPVSALIDERPRMLTWSADRYWKIKVESKSTTTQEEVQIKSTINHISSASLRTP